MTQTATIPVLEAFRRWGHLEADLDPLGRLPLVRHPHLAVGGPEVERARRFYCGKLGVEFAHVPDPERRAWLIERLEQEPLPEPPPRSWERALDLVIRAEVFEQALQQRYLGAKRFSLEGLTALLPLLAELLDVFAQKGAEQAVLAMSHRGRLNVMVHIVGRQPVEVFAGFEDVDPRSTLGSGDVKYHLGATGTWTAASGHILRLHLNSNPSHLEAVCPVALGRVRAKLTRLGDPTGRLVVPILIHGDSAFAGQGIAAETLNLANLAGYEVGGTVHIVANNLIGFTTPPSAYSSTRYATDVAHRLPIPIFHVNGEDLPAVWRAAHLAAEYRNTFGSDVVVDLIGYRRYGHSEVDDPTITQPRLYRQLRTHPPLPQIWAKQFGMPEEELEARGAAYRQFLQEQLHEAARLERAPTLRQLPTYWLPFRGGRYDPTLEVDTGLPASELDRLTERLLEVPSGFHLHPKVERLLDERRRMGAGERPVDFAMAEALAFASLLEQGIPVRLSGQDSRRGTFNQRHAVFIDTETEEEYCPLAGCARGGAFFEIYDSMLSEAAVLGFEYGFSRDYPEALVLWEAQFGDFANGAQVIIDQFLASGEDKWLLLSGLVLLLPHGYEGQGPEHSSARIERFLQLCGEDNWQVCQPSTAAQYFHLLRRQALRSWRKPLIIFTPKSMLRHPDAASPFSEFERPRFLPVLLHPRNPEAQAVQRILVASGKIVHELAQERQRRARRDVAILALEQLYPFPEAELREALGRFSAAREILWVQEEPANMGALSFVLPELERLAPARAVRSVKRSASASPATGSAKAHALEQRRLLELAFA